MMMCMVRRIVTGHDPSGRSVLASDSEVPSLGFGTRGGSLYLTWGRDDVARFPDAGEQPRWSSAWPPVGGCRLTVFELPPGDSKEFDQFILDTLTSFADNDRPGMHSSPTLDFDIVLKGNVGLELDDGEVVLGPGDIVVQNGTVHRWHNRGSTVAQIVSMAIGAEHDRYPT
jgi:quercetin dioxygenase-like cupin family protein